MDLETLKCASKIVTGTKQTSKAIAGNLARHVFIARDAEERIASPVIAACQEKQIPITYVETMEELGKACKIKVRAAMAAILPDE
ncbi:MAG TPA: 50S ribosomal protein L7ae-like protein [Firmicutes bacterium]|nr:50S ribosomal protein L7ae-like protein [Bacillota bacterium]